MGGRCLKLSPDMSCYKSFKRLLKGSQPLSKSNSCKEEAGHREVCPCLVTAICNNASIIRRLKIDFKSCPSCLPCSASAFQVCISSWGHTKLPHVYAPLGWANCGHKSRGEHEASCACWRRPSRFLFSKCVCVHLSPSSFMIPSPPNVFPLSASQDPSPASADLPSLHILPSAQLGPTPNVSNG